MHVWKRVKTVPEMARRVGLVRVTTSISRVGPKVTVQEYMAGGVEQVLTSFAKLIFEALVEVLLSAVFPDYPN